MGKERKLRNEKEIYYYRDFLVIGAIMVGSSLAWWTWSTSSNEQTNVVVTVGGITIDYEDGENITNNNLIPTSTKEKGISKNITVSSTGQVYLDLNMAVVTLDELVMGGGGYSTGNFNSSYYLYTGSYYWTMSPYNFDGTYSSELRVTSDGYINSNLVGTVGGGRPVISLKSDLEFTGNGTMDSPFEVVS